MMAGKIGPLVVARKDGSRAIKYPSLDGAGEDLKVGSHGPGRSGW